MIISTLEVCSLLYFLTKDYWSLRNECFAGKGISIWDVQSHNRSNLIQGGGTGDIACDSYHKIDEDVRNLKKLGVEFYRFSIAWTRILPDGHVKKINQAGIDHYNELINKLLANGIQPVVTMYHWDLPQALEDIGGWLNPDIANYFRDYARVLYENYGDRVKWWVTFNEAMETGKGYEGNAGMAPAAGKPGIGTYHAIHNLLKAHAKAYHLYKDAFKKKQKGKIGMSIVIEWCEPAVNLPEYVAACERYLQFLLGNIAHPIYSREGDYPQVMKERVAMNSAQEGYNQSRLPVFTQEEVKYIQGTYDFFGLNTYTAYMGYPFDWKIKEPFLLKDIGMSAEMNPLWKGSAALWLYVLPWSIRKMLNYIREEYDNPIIMITENGMPDEGHLNDTDRVDYLTSYLAEVLKAIHEDGCNVVGYTYWSFMDNFEWNNGYIEKYGLFHVDFQDPSRPRTMKESAKVFAEMTRTRQIPERFRDKDVGKASIFNIIHHIKQAFLELPTLINNQNAGRSFSIPLVSYFVIAGELICLLLGV